MSTLSTSICAFHVHEAIDEYISNALSQWHCLNALQIQNTKKNLISMLQRNDIFPYMNNKGVDQPAHPLDLISATDQPAHPLDQISVIVVQSNLSGVVRKPFQVSGVVRKPFSCFSFGVSDQVRHKSGFTATEDD